MLWAQLAAADQARLSAAHRQRYYALANLLYRSDTQRPHEARAIALRELPNLLVAVHAALDAGDPDAVDFANRVNLFLTLFGLKQESEALVAKAQAGAGEAGSQAWYLAQSNRGEQLLAAGRVAEAAAVFRAVLENLGHAPSYQRATTLARLGRCFRAGGRPDLAAQQARDAIAVLERLEQTDGVKRQRGVCLTDLADALADQGQYGEARKAYEEGLDVDKELGDLRGQGVTLGQLGTLAMLEGNLAEALDRYRAALTLFQQLREPASEAVFWHQLGRVFEEAGQWDEAERHYREAGRIKEEQGMISGPNSAAGTWNQLAFVTANAGRPEAAEMWYRKAIGAFRAAKDEINLSKGLNNLADLLQNLPGRLAEARQLAEESLGIAKTLDPGAAAIWKTYNILAEIAEKEAEIASEGGLKAQRQAEARQYRRLARDAKRKFAGTRHELRRLAGLILATVRATQNPKHRDEVEQALPGLEQHGGANLVAAIRRVLAGERDPEVLCESLDPEDSMIVETILEALSDPSTLEDLLADQEQG
jgi:tetratricopeptide (TPR) repeat protein